MRPDVSLLVVTGLPRSGTTFIERALAALPGVLALGEPFHASPELRTAQHPGLRAWQNGECPRRWLQSLDRRNGVVTLKLLAGQLSGADTSDVVRLGHTIVCERHPLTSLVSEKQAIASNLWNRLSDTGRDHFGRPITPDAAASAGVQVPVTLGRDEIERQLTRYRQHGRICERLTWRVPYPAALAGEALPRVASWLGIDPRDLRPATLRLHPEPLPDRVANWEVVRRWFPLPEYQHLEEW